MQAFSSILLSAIDRNCQLAFCAVHEAQDRPDRPSPPSLAYLAVMLLRLLPFASRSTAANFRRSLPGLRQHPRASSRQQPSVRAMGSEVDAAQKAAAAG